MSLLDAILLDAQRINLWFAVRSDGNKGCGTQADPYNSQQFDQIMNGLPASPPVRVNLGPGEFLTQGYADDVSGGWQPKPGMKIVGSGIDVTTLKLTGAQDDPGAAKRHYWAIGHQLKTGGSLMDYFEVSDLTIDCDLGVQSGSLFACGALRIMGHHAKARRVKVVNWGTKSSGPPCLVMAMITADPTWTTEQVVDTGLEECVAIDPDTDTATPVSVLHVGPKAPAGAAHEGMGLGPFIRRCYVDCSKFSTPLDLELRALSMGWCQGGVVEGNEIHNVRVGGPFLENASARHLVVRDNTFKNVRWGP